MQNYESASLEVKLKAIHDTNGSAFEDMNFSSSSEFRKLLQELRVFSDASIFLRRENFIRVLENHACALTPTEMSILLNKSRFLDGDKMFTSTHMEKIVVNHNCVAAYPFSNRLQQDSALTIKVLSKSFDVFAFIPAERMASSAFMNPIAQQFPYRLGWKLEFSRQSWKELRPAESSRNLTHPAHMHQDTLLALLDLWTANPDRIRAFDTPPPGESADTWNMERYLDTCVTRHTVLGLVNHISTNIATSIPLVRDKLCTLQWHNIIRLPDVQLRETAVAVFEASRKAGLLAHELHTARDGEDGTRVVHTGDVEHFNFSAIFPDGHEYHIAKPETTDLKFWSVQPHPEGGHTLGLGDAGASEYTSCEPYDHGARQATASNIQRIAMLAHPDLRASLPAVGVEAPDHLKQKISLHHLQWLVDSQCLLINTQFHLQHMVHVNPDAAAGDEFEPGPYLIGSDRAKVFEVQELRTLEHAKKALGEFREWNQCPAGETKMYMFDLSRAAFFQRVIPMTVTLRTHETSTRIASRLMHELLEEDEYILEHRHERMVAAEIRSWANKLALGGAASATGSALFPGGKKVVYTQEGVRAAWKRGAEKLEQRAAKRAKGGERGSRILNLIHSQSDSAISGDWLLCVANLIYPMDARSQLEERRRVPILRMSRKVEDQEAE